MQEMELAPFRYYIENNLGGIMTAHLRVPAYDASGRPASLSPLITTELLRKEMDFDGLIFTDALEMKGAQAGGVPSVAVAALQAGNDILLGPSHPTKALDEIMAALKSGALTEASIEEKCRRVLAFKYALIIAKEDLGVAPEKVKDAIFTKEEAKLRAYLEESAGAKNVAADPTAKTPAMKSQSGRQKSTKR
jgi:glycosyl hydrolase, family 3